jgi:hypothetical protein
MSHFAQIENGVVTQVIVADEDFIASGAVGPASEWVQTSYNTRANAHTAGGTPLRGNYAGRGYTYDAENDVFYAPQPYPSWILNQTTWTWSAPVAYPEDGKNYIWTESTKTWDLVAG